MFPVLQQLRFVQFSPFLNMRESSRRDCSARYSGFDFHGNLEAAVNRMEVRWFMINVVHGDYDSQESADFRHALDLRLRGLYRNVLGVLSSEC